MKKLTKSQQAKQYAREAIFNAGYDACAARLLSHAMPSCWAKLDTDGFTYQQDRRTAFDHWERSREVKG